MRNANLVWQEKPKWETVERDPEWDRWFEMVCDKMKEIFGEDAHTDEQETVAEKALAMKGIRPPSRPCPY
jgi:hypothetical protein